MDKHILLYYYLVIKEQTRDTCNDRMNLKNIMQLAKKDILYNSITLKSKIMQNRVSINLLIEIRSVSSGWRKGHRRISVVVETCCVLICIGQNLIESYT